MTRSSTLTFSFETEEPNYFSACTHTHCQKEKKRRYSNENRKQKMFHFQRCHFHWDNCIFINWELWQNNLTHTHSAQLKQVNKAKHIFAVKGLFADVRTAWQNYWETTYYIYYWSTYPGAVLNMERKLSETGLPLLGDSLSNSLDFIMSRNRSVLWSMFA